MTTDRTKDSAPGAATPDPAPASPDAVRPGPGAPAPVPEGAAARRRRGGWWRGLRALGWACAIGVLLLALSLGALFATLTALDWEVTVPEWAAERVEARLNTSLPGYQVDFRDLSIRLEDRWVPRLALRDVDLRATTGPMRLILADVEGTLALRPALRGQLQPQAIYINGVHLRLRRDAAGQFDLAAVDDAAPGGLAAEGRELGEVMAQLDTLLERPEMRALRRIEGRALTVRYEDARAGRGWTMDGGRVVLARDGDDLRLRADLALLAGRAYATVIDASYATRIGDAAGSFAMSFRDAPAADLATQSAALAWLSVLDAPLSGSLRVAVDSAGRLGPLNAALQIGAGAIQPRSETAPIPFDAVSAYFTFDPDSAMLRFSELSLASRWVALQGEGVVQLTDLAAGMPTGMVGQFSLSEVSTNPGDVYAAPITLSGARMDMRMELDPFRLTIGELSLGLAGDTAVFSGDFLARAEGWDVTLEGRMGRIGAEDVLTLWPAGVASKTRDWISRNVLQARLHDLQLGLRSLPGSRPEGMLGFEFSRFTGTFMETMPPIRNGHGHATLLRDRFVVTADGGEVTAPDGGVAQIAGTSFIVPDVRIKKGPAQIRLALDAPIPAVLSLLDQEPFRIMTKAGRPTDLATGRAQARGVIDLRLVKGLPPEEIAFDFAGTVSDVASTQIVPGRTLTAARLSVTANAQQVQLSGRGKLGRVAFDGSWTAPLRPGGGGGADAEAAPEGRSEVSADITLSNAFMEEFRIALPDDAVSGTGRARLRVALEKGQEPEFRLTSDLAGIGLRLDALDWAMSRAATGTLEIGGRLGTPPSVDRLRIEAPGLLAQGALSLSDDGSLQRAEFSRVRVGGWLDGPVTLTGRGPGVPAAATVQGGTVDLRQAEFAGSGAGGGPVALRLDRLQITDGLHLEGFRGDFTTAGGMSGQFTGRLNGGPVVSGQLVPRDGGSVVRVQADNAGAVFAATDLLKQARGGSLDLTLVPTGGRKGVYDGRLNVADIAIQDAPAMAGLLSAISVVGLLEQMTSGGIVFNDVDAAFRLTPDRLILTESSAVGASMGLSMDGYYDFAQGAMDMQGVISPLYLLNGIGQILTRKGEGLIGFNFTLTGAAGKPRVAVNPLSLLTPGMFREIFRRPAPRLDQ
ncbi:AsmA-like C-terminal region-containing protein [Pseudooceanicola aestuarii]|uniref:AsmA-like C-terminal region-containing protein n=1 Tax=Pseudooceanicola aestuarii TaxID=2697319 RepID=UPI0013D6175B|nr:AsmA-like C-terminal region-containing protein [Pseudooceanicola aestuarii]